MRRRVRLRECRRRPDIAGARELSHRPGVERSLARRPAQTNDQLLPRIGRVERSQPLDRNLERSRLGGSVRGGREPAEARQRANVADFAQGVDRRGAHDLVLCELQQRVHGAPGAELLHGDHGTDAQVGVGALPCPRRQILHPLRIAQRAEAVRQLAGARRAGRLHGGGDLPAGALHAASREPARRAHSILRHVAEQHALAAFDLLRIDGRREAVDRRRHSPRDEPSRDPLTRAGRLGADSERLNRRGDDREYDHTCGQAPQGAGRAAVTALLCGRHGSLTLRHRANEIKD